MTAMAKLNKNSKKTKKFIKKGKKEFKSTGKRGRLIVRNLPFKCDENELHKLFKPFGEIKDIQLLRRPNKQPVGCGFVEFTSRLNADRAVEKLNGTLLQGRSIYVERAVARERYDESSMKEKETNKDQEKESESEEDKDEEDIIDDSEIKEEPSSDNDECAIKTEDIKEELSSGEEEESPPENKNKKDSFKGANKNEKAEKNIKKARLIVRNLSFKTTVDKVIEHFSPFGEVKEVKLLRRSDNTLVGCGFVQFAKKLSAAKAIHHTSGKPFLGRPIIVDWAVSKDKFKKLQDESLSKEIKKESEDDEDYTPMDTSNVTVKKESDSDEESGDENESEEESKESSEEEDEDEEDDDESEIKQEHEEVRQRRRVEDVDEGKTVFVKNLPFSVDDEEFRECMEQYGPVFYALVCKDKLTERSKGSGFVKFKNKEDAEKCLSAGTELKINGTTLDPHPALKRTEAEKLKEKSKEKKDNRNLYLVKEGLIIAGTPAAKGVSVSDMEKRLQLEQWKTTKLRNLNMFVSNNRLVVHNLPATLSDKQLRKLFQKHAGPKAVIKEARIMRNLKNVDDKGQGVSKGYGFVSFENHEDALTALRKINNNPTIFTPSARPIVAFSIENRAVLNMKLKRLERSRQKNPLCKEYKPDDEEVPATKKIKRNEKQEEDSGPQYAGMVAKPGGDVKLRKKHKLKSQAVQHMQDVKQQKRESKMSRKVRRTEHIKQKQGEKKSMKKNNKAVDKDEAFTKLVDKYKSKFLSQSREKKKWYDE